MRRTFKDLSESIGRVGDVYAGLHGIERSPDWYLLKMQEELGELTAEHLRLSGRARCGPEGSQRAREKLEDEAADLFGQLVLYLRANGIDIESAIERKWLQHLDKHPELQESAP